MAFSAVDCLEIAENRRARSWTLDWAAGKGLCSLKADEEAGGEDENEVGIDLCGTGEGKGETSITLVFNLIPSINDKAKPNAFVESSLHGQRVCFWVSINNK